MTEEQDATENPEGADGPVVDGREEADKVAEELKDREDEIEGGDSE